MTRVGPDDPSIGANYRRAVITRYRSELHRYFSRRVRSPADAEDLVQEVCLRFLRSHKPFCKQKPLAYLYGIAAHVLADHRQTVARGRECIVEDAELLRVSRDAFRMVEEHDDIAHRQMLLRALSQLPIMHCSVLIAHKCDGLTYRETAQKLKLSVHTVEKYLTQAKAHLRLMCRD